MTARRWGAMRYLRTVLLGLLVLGGTELSALSPRSALAVDASVVEGDNWFCDPSHEFGDCPTTISAGDSVTWIYPDGSRVHTTTACGASCDSPTGTPSWDSGFMYGGDTFTWKFDTPGAFLYYCSLHPIAMRGTIIVESQPTPTPTPMPTPTPTPTLIHTPTPTPTPAVLRAAEGGPMEGAPEAGQEPTSATSLPTGGGPPPRGGSGLSPWTLVLAAGGLLALAGVAVSSAAAGGRRRRLELTAAIVRLLFPSNRFGGGQG